MTKQWSSYQTDIFYAVEGSRRNLAVNAVAGSGKTTTLVEIYNRLPRRASVVFLAFNKHIVNELSSRLPGCTVQTIHSMGLKAIRASKPNAKVSEYKVSDLIDEYLSRNQPTWLPDKFYGTFAGMVKEVVAKSRLTLTDLRNGDQTDAMMDHFGIWGDIASLSSEGDLSADLIARQLIKVAQQVLRNSNSLYERYGTVDFDDMLYIPAQYGLPVQQYDVVLVDEAQDMNAAQLELVVKASKGRIIAVGDPRQAIMGFAGADNESFAKIVSRTNAVEMPLSVCYRCPVKHISMAKEIVPQIEAAPGAQDGVIEEITKEQMIQMIRQGDLVISRTNAPLVGVALKLIANGIQARVRGRNIAAGLTKLIKEATKRGINGDSFAGALTEALERQIEHRLEILRAKPHTEAQQETLQDQKECIIVFLSARPEINSAQALCSELEALFADEGAAVWCSSIHRAKGLEADRVFVINSDKMELVFSGQQGWEKEQERNLKYVGLTRAKRALYLIPSNKKAEEAPQG